LQSRTFWDEEAKTQLDYKALLNACSDDADKNASTLYVLASRLCDDEAFNDVISRGLTTTRNCGAEFAVVKTAIFFSGLLGCATYREGRRVLKTKAVLFDLGGTLVLTEAAAQLATEKAKGSTQKFMENLGQLLRRIEL